jgi:ferredoxin
VSRLLITELNAGEERNLHCHALMLSVHACAAKALRQDAQKFAEVMRDVETALISASDLGKHQECLKTIGSVLDEAAEHLKRLQTANYLSKLTWAKHDREKFSGFRDQLSLAIQSLSLTVQLDLASLHHAKFEESAKFDAVISELGGIDAIKADPALLDQATEKLNNVDKLHIAIARENRCVLCVCLRVCVFVCTHTLSLFLLLTLIHSRTHSLTHALTHSLTHSLARSRARARARARSLLISHSFSATNWKGRPAWATRPTRWCASSRTTR